MIKIFNQPQLNEIEKIRLNNGNIILWKDMNSNEVLGIYMVTSFRNNRKNAEYWNNTTQYCTLLNLMSGVIEFEEPCSRSTTKERVLCHLNRALYSMKDVKGSIFVYDTDGYNIDIKLK